MNLIAPIIVFLGIPAFFFLGMFRRFTGLARGHAALVWFGSIILAGVSTGYRFSQMEDLLHNVRGRQEMEYVIMFASGFLLVPVSALLGAKLYHRWIGGQFTPEEKMPGADGVRAWLRGGNLIVAALISLFAWLGYGCSFPVILMVTLAALLAYPLLNFQPSTPVTVPEAPKQAGAQAERDRILKLVEEGKITAADSATLLAALGSAPHGNAHGAAMSPARKLVCAGAACVVVGFFLPWFSVNAADEMKRGVNQAAEQFGQTFPGAPASLPGGGPAFAFQTPTIHRNGGEMPHGLGWIALVLAVGVAVLPFVVPTMARETQRMLAFGALGVGAFAVIYLLTQDARHAGFGMVLAIAGYALEFVGTMRDRPA